MALSTFRSLIESIDASHTGTSVEGKFTSVDIQLQRNEMFKLDIKGSKNLPKIKSIEKLKNEYKEEDWKNLEKYVEKSLSKHSKEIETIINKFEQDLLNIIEKIEKDSNIL